MDDTPEVIRQQMEETKLQLSNKLESLEHQVSETVQSTGTAVNATVEAVHETVDAVTVAVQDAVESVSHAFDIRRQANRHPWLVIGGAVVAGYLAAELLTRSATKSGHPPEPVPSPSPTANNANHRNGQPASESAATTAALSAAREISWKSTSWHQVKNAAIGTLIVIAREITARAVPQVMDYFSRSHLLANGVGAEITRPTALHISRSGSMYE